MLDDIERTWSQKLQVEVEIVGRGWQHSPDDFALYLDGHYIDSFRTIAEIEGYLADQVIEKEVDGF